MVRVLIAAGSAAHYGKGVMEGVSRNRELPLASCMVSSPTLKIGTWIWVHSLRNNKWLKCRVTDTSGRLRKCSRGRCETDQQRHIRTGLVIEFDWPSAMVMCDLEYVGQRSPKQCPVEVYIDVTTRDTRR